MALPASVYVHPQALVESEEIGAETRIWAFAHVMKGARIGRRCNICDHAFVESNVVIGDDVTLKNGVALWDGVTLENHVFVGPFAVFTNDPNPRAAVKKSRESFLPTIVREGASIGANATIICGVTLGRFSFVGAGAVVTRDVPDYAIVRGNPARVSAFMCQCGEKLPADLICPCGLSYTKSGAGLNPIASVK
jgi:UDP-2-acetamido-3-amino-2,3-dideoxy-glucuronate N-acetyltransferase